jgi:hypothetical protein
MIATGAGVAAGFLWVLGFTALNAVFALLAGADPGAWAAGNGPNLPALVYVAGPSRVVSLSNASCDTSDKAGAV